MLLKGAFKNALKEAKSYLAVRAIVSLAVLSFKIKVMVSF